MNKLEDLIPKDVRLKLEGDDVVTYCTVHSSRSNCKWWCDDKLACVDCSYKINVRSDDTSKI